LPAETSPTGTWAARAEQAYAALVDRFWDRRRGLFRVFTGWRGSLRDPWHYWWQAHALDCVVDAVGRGAAAEAERAQRLVEGIVRRNGGRVENAYYDDMAWLGLALDRAGSVAGLPVGDLVDRLWAELREGWHEAGGVRWRRDDTYRNVAASAPTALLAVRRGDKEYARRIVDWLGEVLVDPADRVLDGVHARPGAVPHREWYSYNQGTVAAAYAELGEPDRGLRIALAGLPASGLLPDEGGGDRGLFKGIYARYAADVARAVGAAAAPLREGLARHGERAWAARSPEGLFGASWEQPPAGAVELSGHLSGVLLMSSLR
jgi:predicted alpha-1,6-mannanase (GH76 family)